MQRYDTYKDSGVKWLGEIPSHWEMISTKYIAKLYTGNSLNDASKEKYSLFSDDSYPYIASKDISLGTGTVDYDNGLYIPKDESFFEIAPKNSFLLCIEGGSAGRKKAFLDRNCCFVNKLCCFDSVLNPKYHYYFIQGDYFRTMFNCSLQGMIGGVSVSALKNFYTIVPPLEEQTAIANYLDTATSKIDAAIAQQQKMIDLLNERKQIIINRAVTKGLNPNAKMKDSGVEWIGEVPEGWEVRRVKTITSKVGSGVTPRGGGETYVDKGVMFLRSQNIYFEGFKLDDVAFITDAVDASMSNTRVKEGDVLFNITGGSIGRCYYVPKGFPKANVNQHVSIVRPCNFSTEYLYYLLRSPMSQIQVDLQQTGGNREGLTAFALKNFVFPIPPNTEQKMIIEYLNIIDFKLNQTIQNCQKQISLLQERKQIIINEVVTGKVKVV